MILLKSNVRDYSDKELLDKVTELPSFKKIPNNIWILGVQSNEKEFNVFNDKFYAYKGTTNIAVLNGTTHAGITGLKNYDRYNKNGCAVIKTNEWYYDLWKKGYHKSKMPALVQNTDILYYRDKNKNDIPEQTGPLHKGKIGINFHTVSYQKDLSFWRKLIGGWSVGCQVVNHVGQYYDLLDKIDNGELITYCLIDEF